MILNAANLALLTQAVNAAFMAGNGAMQTAESAWNQVAMEIPSATSENVYPYLKSMGTIRKWVGDRVIQNLAQGDFRLGNDPFEETHGIPRDKVEDDQYGIYSKLFEQLGRNVRNFQDRQVFSLLKAGFTSLGPDGQYFFDTDHPVGQPGQEVSVSNFMGGSGEPWFIMDGSQVYKPLIWQPRKAFNLVTLFDETDPNVFFRKEFIYGVDGRSGAGYSPFWQLMFASKNALDATNVKATLTAMSMQKDDEGTPLGVMGTHIIVGPALAETARALFENEFTANGASNEMKGRLKVISTRWLL